MEARLKRVEDDVVEIRSDVQQVKETVVVLDDRQRRMHNDFTDLTQALNNATTEINKITRMTEKRGSFIAGAVFIIGAFGTAVAAVLTILKDWIGS